MGKSPPLFHFDCKNTKKLNIVKEILLRGITNSKFCSRIDAV